MAGRLKPLRLWALLTGATCCLGATGVGTGVGATFTSKGTITQRVNAGSILLHAVACQSASDDSEHEKSDDEGPFSVRDGQPCTVEDEDSKTAPDAPTAPRATSQPSAGFTSTADVFTSNLSTSPSDLPLSLQAIVSNKGTLPVDHIQLSVSVAPSTTPATALVATVLWDGHTVAGPEPLSSLIATPVPMLFTGAPLAPGKTGFVQIDLDKASKATKTASVSKQFSLTAQLVGSDT